MVTIRKHRHQGKVKYRTKKGKIKYRKRPLHNRISKNKRKVFTSLAKQPYELGGPLDFEKGNLENAKIHFGDASEVEFDWDPDYEGTFHTHISIEGASIMPSFEDINSMKETKEREQLIFHKNIALSIAESDKFQKVSDKKIKEVSNLLQRDYVKGMSDKSMYNKYKPIFKRELGLDMNWHKPKKDIKLKSRSV